MLIRSIQQACLLSTGAGQHTLLKRDADTAGGGSKLPAKFLRRHTKLIHNIVAPCLLVSVWR